MIYLFYLVKIKLEFFIEIDVKSRGYMMVLPPVIIKYQHVEIREYKS